MLRKELIFILWEDDTKGGGHSACNPPMEVKSARVQHNGPSMGLSVFIFRLGVSTFRLGL